MKSLALCTLCVAFPLLAQAQALAVKTGGWEATLRSTVAGKTEVTTTKSCVKKADLENLGGFANPEEGCKQELGTRTPTRVVLSSVCSGSGMQSRSEIEINVTSPETVVSKIASQIMVGGKTDTLRIESTARWRSPSCAGYDEE